MQKLSQMLLHLFGWKIQGKLPLLNKYILIVAPHTSNWDLLVGLTAQFAVGGRFHFLAKKQLFFFPLNLFLKAMGGIPVDRSKSQDLVEQAVQLFEQKEKFVLGITPEGTRSPVKRWKTGFYHIANKAKIPIVMVGFDYAKKEIIINEPFWPTGDINKDFPQVLDFYRGIQGRYPQKIPDF
ncbi:acyltransferase [Legionella israelensis]|uniref:1-acyl-sn-glycerol-3-phosphate acyltransferase n=1 Tax=Legionella israelensis TaxID=454 RepID=UPI00117FC882|nr:1-acyl-sn-glycerol-3-phosphate acyltransferase [Legionella israelensis]QDP72860.1 acyltransferase [Legionella israelensis]